MSAILPAICICLDICRRFRTWWVLDPGHEITCIPDTPGRRWSSGSSSRKIRSRSSRPWAARSSHPSSTLHSHHRPRSGRSSGWTTSRSCSRGSSSRSGWNGLSTSSSPAWSTGAMQGPPSSSHPGSDPGRVQRPGLDGGVRIRAEGEDQECCIVPASLA